MNNKLFLSLVCSAAAVLSAPPAICSDLRREMYVSRYTTEVKRDPWVFVNQMSYILIVTDPSIDKQLPLRGNVYSQLQFDRDRLAALRKISGILPSIGIGISFGGVTLNYDVGKLAGAGVRTILGIQSEQDLRRRVHYLANDTQTIRRLGEITYDSYLSRDAKLYPLYGIVSQASDLSPENPPAYYLERDTSFLGGVLSAKLSNVPEKRRSEILSNWPQFEEFVSDAIKQDVSAEKLKRFTRRHLNRSKADLTNVAAKDPTRPTAARLSADLEEGQLGDQAALNDHVVKAAEAAVARNDDLDAYLLGVSSLRKIVDIVEPGQTGRSMRVALDAINIYLETRKFTGAIKASSSAAFSSGATLALSIVTMAFDAAGNTNDGIFIKAVMETQVEILRQLREISTQLQDIRLSIGDSDNENRRRYGELIDRITVIKDKIDRLEEAVHGGIDELKEGIQQIDYQNVAAAAARLRIRAQKPQSDTLTEIDFAVILDYLERGASNSIYVHRHVDQLSQFDASQDILSYGPAIARYTREAIAHYRYRLQSASMATKGRSIREAVESLGRLEENDQQWPSPAAFQRGAAILADSIVRFPRLFPTGLKIGQVCRAMSLVKNGWSSLVNEVPAMLEVLKFDFHDLQHKWSALKTEAVEAAISVFPYGERQIINFIYSTTEGDFEKAYICIDSREKGCDDTSFRPPT